MPTVPEQTAPAARDFQSLFTLARRQVVHGPGDVHALDLDLDGPPLRARSRLMTSGALTFIRGQNSAAEDLVLRYEGNAPTVTLHAPLRGSATSRVDGLGDAIGDRAGKLQLFAAPTSRTTVHLRAHVSNEAFRITMAPASIAALASRYAQLESLATRVVSGAAFCLPPVAVEPLHRVLDDVADIMERSEQYGALRPLFLEARALGWLAAALRASPSARPDRLPAREVDRMHEARDFLLARLADPPTLAEVALAVGTNDFALKRHFKVVFGQPVHAHLLGVRLAHAAQLLRDTGDSIKEIAAAVGYAHANHFSVAFRRSYGVSPARYRATARGG
jgi:AraC family transcriptional activator of pyochelin receptor